jgi:alpha-beta hydrolase superfamily lysophospholipase
LPEPLLELANASDGYRWYYRVYRPAGRPRGQVVFLHGVQSHGGWYVGTCEALCAAGYLVWFLERRGCGLNTAHRGDAPSFRRLLDDVAEHLRRLRGLGLPLVLVAISWGGKLAVSLQYREPGLCDGLALVCPGLAARIHLPFWQRLAIVRARLLRPTRLFPIPLNDPELFTTNPQWQTFLRHDPHALHLATARLMFISFQLDVYLRRAWQAVEIPTVLFLAGEDRVIDNERTRRYVARFPAPVQIIEYPHNQHTLEFEPSVEQFRADLLTWLDTVVQAQQQRTGPKAASVSPPRADSAATAHRP